MSDVPMSNEQNDIFAGCLTTTLLTLSIFSLVITIALYQLIPELHSDYTYYQLNCYVTHLASNIFFFVCSSSFVSRRKVSCYVCAFILHYSLLSSFTWMLVTGFYVFYTFQLLNRQIGIAAAGNVRLLRSSCNLFASNLVGHGLPAMFVIICLLCDSWFLPGSVGYGRYDYHIDNDVGNDEVDVDNVSDAFCWIHGEKGLLTVFIIPSGILLFFNLFIFLGCLYFLLHFHWRNGSGNNNNNNNSGLSVTRKAQRRIVFALIKFLIGLGLQWLFGIAGHFWPEDPWIRYLFIVSVSAHGVLILVTTLMLKAVWRWALMKSSTAIARLQIVLGSSTNICNNDASSSRIPP